MALETQKKNILEKFLDFLRAAEFRAFLETILFSLLTNETTKTFIETVKILSTNLTIMLITFPLIGLNIFVNWCYDVKNYFKKEGDPEKTSNFDMATSTIFTGGAVTAVIGTFVGFALAPLFFAGAITIGTINQAKQAYNNFKEAKKDRTEPHSGEEIAYEKKYKRKYKRNLFNVALGVAILTMVTFVMITPIGWAAMAISAGIATIGSGINYYLNRKDRKDAEAKENKTNTEDEEDAEAALLCQNPNNHISEELSSLDRDEDLDTDEYLGTDEYLDTDEDIQENTSCFSGLISCFGFFSNSEKETTPTPKNIINENVNHLDKII